MQCFNFLKTMMILFNLLIFEEFLATLAYVLKQKQTAMDSNLAQRPDRAE